MTFFGDQMILSNGFTKKRCAVVGKELIVDGKPYEVYKLEEIKDFKKRNSVAAAIIIIGGIIISPFVYREIIGLRNDVDGIVDSLISGGVLLFSLIWYIFICYVLYTQMGYRSYWRINDEYNIYLCVEKHDSTDIDTVLRSIAK